MFCPACGKKNSKTARFCIYCGQTLPGSGRTGASSLAVTRQVGSKNAAGRRGRGSNTGLVIALIAAVAVVLVMLFVALLALLVSEQGDNLASQGISTVTVRIEQVIVAPRESTPTSRAAPTLTSPAATRVTVSSTAIVQPSATPRIATPTLTPKPPATVGTAPSGSSARVGCRNAQKGLIGFKRQKRCDKRTGNACGPIEIWVMNADGSGQAPMCNAGAYERGLVRDRTSPDGTWRVEVSSGKADIIRVYTNGQSEWLIVNNRKDWDPVLSADGWWLAWVTNRNANDEIYIKTLDPRDQNQRRLTVNDWEWDKHPTWSPDGQKIAFYSNRANKLSEASCQIWVMQIVNDRGTNLRNLSNDPDRVDTDPVWFKWDDVP